MEKLNYLQSFDPKNPDPWLAIELDQSLPMSTPIKDAYISGQKTISRRILYPIIAPICRMFILFISFYKLINPKHFTSSRLVHLLIYWALRSFVTPSANKIILRHFSLGSEILEFIGKNIKGIKVKTFPLRPTSLRDIKDGLILQHDINLFNFIIRVNKQLKAKNLELEPISKLDFSVISTHEFSYRDIPNRWTNMIDLETAMEIFTPLFQLFITNDEFQRAVHSLQCDEIIAIYLSKILGKWEPATFAGNRHPLVKTGLSHAAYDLILHGISTEMIYQMLQDLKSQQKITITA